MDLGCLDLCCISVSDKQGTDATLTSSESREDGMSDTTATSKIRKVRFLFFCLFVCFFFFFFHFQCQENLNLYFFLGFYFLFFFLIFACLDLRVNSDTYIHAHTYIMKNWLKFSELNFFTKNNSFGLCWISVWISRNAIHFHLIFNFCIIEFQYFMIAWLNSNLIGVSSIFYIGYRLTFCLLLNSNEFKIFNCLEEKCVQWNRYRHVRIFIGTP
jgi:hypothetical protein